MMQIGNIGRHGTVNRKQETESHSNTKSESYSLFKSSVNIHSFKYYMNSLVFNFTNKNEELKVFCFTE